MLLLFSGYLWALEAKKYYEVKPSLTQAEIKRVFTLICKSQPWFGDFILLLISRRICPSSQHWGKIDLQSFMAKYGASLIQWKYNNAGKQHLNRVCVTQADQPQKTQPGDLQLQTCSSSNKSIICSISWFKAELSACCMVVVHSSQRPDCHSLAPRIKRGEDNHSCTTRNVLQAKLHYVLHETYQTFPDATYWWNL